MMIVLDRNLTDAILKDRRAKGNRLRDETWDGVTYVMPDPDNEHQRMSVFFSTIFSICFGLGKGGDVESSPNLSDRIEDWNENFRNPDMAYFSKESDAEDHDTFWYGGPDFLLEIISPNDKSRDKLAFYASIGTKEVLVIDRDPWQLELYQLKRGRLKLAGSTRPGDAIELASAVVPLTFGLIRSKSRPKIRIRNTATGEEWKF